MLFFVVCFIFFFKSLWIFFIIISYIVFRIFIVVRIVERIEGIVVSCMGVIVVGICCIFINVYYKDLKGIKDVVIL